MKNISPVQTIAWKQLKNHFKVMKNIHMCELFNKDPNRFKKFSIFFKENVLIDYSKNRITDLTIQMLLNLANEMHLFEAIKSMFIGKKINVTEDRPVLHTALRNNVNQPIFIDGLNIMDEVHQVLKKMEDFSNQVISGQWRGYSGKKIKNIVNIGIGGSDLGPKMVSSALTPYKNHLNMFYLSNIDSTDVLKIININDFESTIFLISSKTFSTQETITNANTIKSIFVKKCQNIEFMNKHFFAITANKSLALNFGIPTNNIFMLWDWVGGRYSIWSAMGLSIILSIGYKNFCELLRGAYDMDVHFQTSSLEKNIPVLLGLIGIWYNNFFHSETEAILPYDQYLHRLPSYIQQSNMESNGKNIDRNGNKVSWQTGPIIWGSVGTNGQHSFFQLIHQGTKLIPCDFIAAIQSHNPINQHHTILLSNFFAQTHSLAFGDRLHNSCYDNKNIFVDSSTINYIKKFKTFEGNHPSNSFLFAKMDPYSLGWLIAMYEHKIFTQGIILNIFSFDQWGVELGKKISNDILNCLSSGKDNLNYDNSTNGLIKFYRSCKR